MTRLGYEASSSLGNNLFICTNFSDECEGEIAIGNPQTCTIENVLVKLNFLDLAVVSQFENNVSILLGNGDGTFGAKTDFGTGNRPVSVAVGLFNADLKSEPGCSEQR